MTPIAWTKEARFELYYGIDPGVGQFSMHGMPSAFHEPVKIGFAPVFDPGTDIVTTIDRLKSMRKDDDSHYKEYEYQRLSAMTRMGTADRAGYVYDAPEGMRLIEVARSRPAVGAIEEMIFAAGFKFQHYLDGQFTKVYMKKIPYGYVNISRGINNLHLTFERTTANSWTNVFRYHKFNTTQSGDLWPVIWPDYLDSMEIATYLALDTARQFEANGHNRKRAYKAK